MGLNLERIDVESFLKALDIRNVSKRDLEYWQFSCPFPEHKYGDLHPSAQMRDDNTYWNCFSCHRGGTAISFLADFEGVSELEARRWLREEYDSDFREPIAGSRNEWTDRFTDVAIELSEVKLPTEEDLEKMSVDWIDLWCEWNETQHKYGPRYMYERGFQPESMMEWEIGFDSISNRIAIPVRAENNLLMGIKLRSTDDGYPKYYYAGDKHGGKNKYGFGIFNKSDVVFGLNKAKLHCDDTLIVCEGELDCISMHEKGWQNTVAIAGSELSDEQALLLRDNCDRVILFFDNDEAGDRATRTYARQLEPHLHVSIAGTMETDPAAAHSDMIYNALNELTPSYLL